MILMLSVRLALLEDAALLHRMAKRLHIEGRDLNTAEATGFFLYAGSEEDYAATIAASPYCYVAVDGEQSAGFLTTMTPEQVSKHPSPKNRALFEENGEYPMVLEQIGVLPDFQGKGIGQALLDRLMADCPVSRVVATVVHWPVSNQRSIGFLVDRNGWRHFREVRTAKRVWGFYEWLRF